MSSKITYRPDIDGLRAIAVLSVIIFHLKASWLPGGFLGVDIFFVISGYLITSIIYKQMEEGRFSFTDFYNRRVKRILPVFFVVLWVGLGLSAYVMLPQDARRVGESALSSIFFIANLYFAKGSNYFDILSEEKPFLHIWSLSVEEQYYFVFPIILCMLFRFSALRRHLFRYILGIFLGLVLLSFFDLGKIGLPLDRYYLPHLRFIEIFSGSLLAIVIARYNVKISNPIAMAVSSFSLITMLILFWVGDMLTAPYFPGVLGLVPAVVTALFIFANAEKHWVSRLCSSPLMVWVGKISYSLYLWHWVILALFRYVWQSSELPMLWIIVAVILTFGLSIMTFYWVETPMRNAKFSLGKNVTYFYAIPALVVGVFYVTIQNFNFNIDAELLYPEHICHNSVGEHCIKGDTSKKPKVLCIGNSYMGQLNPWIDKVGKHEGWSSIVVTSDSYPFIFDKKWEHNILQNYSADRDQFFLQHYKDFPIIVLHYDKYDSTLDTDYNNKLIQTIKRLKSEDKKVYIITSTTRTNVDVLKNYFLTQRFPSFAPKIQAEYNGYSENLLDFIPDSLVEKKIDLRPYIPSNLYLDGKPVLKDKDHWNVYGAERVADLFLGFQHTFIHPKDLN